MGMLHAWYFCSSKSSLIVGYISYMSSDCHKIGVHLAINSFRGYIGCITVVSVCCFRGYIGCIAVVPACSIRGYIGCITVVPAWSFRGYIGCIAVVPACSIRGYIGCMTVVPACSFRGYIGCIALVLACSFICDILFWQIFYFINFCKLVQAKNVSTFLQKVEMFKNNVRSL